MFPFCKKENKPEQVKCETCKHWVDKEDCQEVKYSNNLGLSKKIYFCPIHNVKWDEMFTVNCDSPFYSDASKITYYKTIPAHEVEVDEEGKEIKKK